MTECLGLSPQTKKHAMSSSSNQHRCPFVVHLFMNGATAYDENDLAFHETIWRVCQDLMVKFKARCIYTKQHHVFMMFFPDQAEAYRPNLLMLATEMASYASVRFVGHRPRNRPKYKHMYFVSQLMPFETTEECAEYILEEFYNNYTAVVSRLGYESKEVEQAPQWKLYGTFIKRTFYITAPTIIVCNIGIEKYTLPEITTWLEAELVG